MLAPMERQNYNRAIRQNAKVYGIWETPQHGSPSFAMSARKGQRARHDALDYRIDGTRELRPKALASFFVPAPSLKDSSSASGRKTTRRVTLLPTTSGELRTRGPRCRVSSRGQPTGDPAQPVVQGSTPLHPRAR